MNTLYKRLATILFLLGAITIWYQFFVLVPKQQQLLLAENKECATKGERYFKEYTLNQMTQDGWSAEYHFNSKLNTCLINITQHSFMSEFIDSRIFDVYSNKIILYSSLYQNQPASPAGQDGLPNLTGDEFDKQKIVLFNEN